MEGQGPQSLTLQRMRGRDDQHLARQHLAKVLQSVAISVGAGKSVAVRATTSALDPSRHQVVYCPNPTIGGRGLLILIVSTLGGNPRFYRARVVPQAAEALPLAESERGRRVLVVVEEAHLLQSDQLEDLRMLGNDGTSMDSLSPAAFLLVGQPLLRRRLRQGNLAAVDQRVTLRVHLDGMDLAETAAYIKHHLALAGRSDTLFSDDALAVISRPRGDCPAWSTTLPSKPW